MTKQANDNKIRKNNIINDFTKKNIFEYLFSNNSILNYKLIFYWLPPLIFSLTICFIIFITHSESEYFISFIAGITMFIIYFVIDIIYQLVLCKKTNKINLIKNSFKNSLVPTIFVSVGYLLSIILRDVKKCDIRYQNTGVEHAGESHKINTDITRLINIHRNNIIVSIFFYIFSIIYNNPINKKKCSNNNLC
tara:strand:- start:123 stop:701 length:579 start_codon:yes stop_codon:yes gene_type:complete